MCAGCLGAVCGACGRDLELGSSGAHAPRVAVWRRAHSNTQTGTNTTYIHTHTHLPRTRVHMQRRHYTYKLEAWTHGRLPSVTMGVRCCMCAYVCVCVRVCVCVCTFTAVFGCRRGGLNLRTVSAVQGVCGGSGGARGPLARALPHTA